MSNTRKSIPQGKPRVKTAGPPQEKILYEGDHSGVAYAQSMMLKVVLSMMPLLLFLLLFQNHLRKRKNCRRCHRARAHALNAILPKTALYPPLSHPNIQPIPT